MRRQWKCKKEFKGLNKGITQLTGDKDAASTELAAVVKCYGKVKDRRVAKPDQYYGKVKDHCGQRSRKLAISRGTPGTPGTPGTLSTSAMHAALLSLRD